MKKIISLFTLLAIFFTSSLIGVGFISWYHEYPLALQVAKRTGKPIFIFFTGSNWCTWCQKLQKEVLDTREFAEAMGDQFIFLELDFPRNKPQDPKIAEQNKKLQELWGVKGFPEIIIIDKSEKKLGNLGYKAGGPAPFAQALNDIVEKK